MPRKRTPKGHTWTSKKWRLSETAREGLVDAAGLDVGGKKARMLIEDVEEAISEALNQRHSLEEGPSASERERDLQRVEKAAAALEESLRILDQESWMAIREESSLIEGDDERPDFSVLAAFRKAVHAERLRCLDDKKQGRPREGTRDMAMRELARIFQQMAGSSIDDHYAVSLRQFLYIALRAAGLPVKEKGEKEKVSEEEKILSDKLSRRLPEHLKRRETTEERKRRRTEIEAQIEEANRALREIEEASRKGT